MMHTAEQLLITQWGAILPFASAPSLASLLVTRLAAGSAAAVPLPALCAQEHRLPRASPEVGSCTQLHRS